MAVAVAADSGSIRSLSSRLEPTRMSPLTASESVAPSSSISAPPEASEMVKVGSPPTVSAASRNWAPPPFVSSMKMLGNGAAM